MPSGDRLSLKDMFSMDIMPLSLYPPMTGDHYYHLMKGSASAERLFQDYCLFENYKIILK
jgi:hypothetical protein